MGRCGKTWFGDLAGPNGHVCILETHARGGHKCHCGAELVAVAPEADQSAEALLDALAEAVHDEDRAISLEEGRVAEAATSVARQVVRARMRPWPTAEALWDHISANTYAVDDSVGTYADQYRTVSIEHVRAAIAALGGGK